MRALRRALVYVAQRELISNKGFLSQGLGGVLNRVAPAVAVGRLVPSMTHAAQQPLWDLPPFTPDSLVL